MPAIKRKYILAAGIVLAVLLADQLLKYWVKSHMTLREEFSVSGHWFYLHFIENNGMAFGLEFGGQIGKYILTFFRIIFVIAGFWYLNRIITKKLKTGLMICVALIIAGAVGNIIDSVFYGITYSDLNEYKGGWFEGRVVDMLYFPIIETHYPQWFPMWGGEEFIFFSPVFNLADAAISVWVISLVLFQNRLFPKTDSESDEKTENNEIHESTEDNQTQGISDSITEENI